MLIPPMMPPGPKVVAMPHTSVTGSAHYVDCKTCRELSKARDACLARGDEVGAGKLEVARVSHCKRRHAEADASWTPLWVVPSLSAEGQVRVRLLVDVLSSARLFGSGQRAGGPTTEGAVSTALADAARSTVGSSAGRVQHQQEPREGQRMYRADAHAGKPCP